MIQRTHERRKGKFISYTGYIYISKDWDFILVRRGRGHTGEILGMCWDLNRQVTHPGCLEGGTHRNRKRWGAG